MNRRWIHNPNPDAAWYAAHPGRAARCEPRRSPEKYRMLRVSTEFYTAGAVWVKRCGVWAATQTDPILDWMRFKSPGEVHLTLLKMGADFQWLDINSPTVLSGSNQPSMGASGLSTICPAVRPTLSRSSGELGDSVQEQLPLATGTASLPAPPSPAPMAA